MNMVAGYDYRKLFDLEGQAAVVTGGGGVLCSAMGKVLAAAGATVALVDLKLEAAERAANEICSQGGRAIGLSCDVTDRDSLQEACDRVRRQLGRVDILINGAGGNQPRASTSTENSFFDLESTAVESVFRLNFMGTFLACQVFGRQMAAQQRGVILNVASMNSLRPLTRIPAYSAAKGAVANFTQWLAVHLAQEYGPQLRANAIAPGFFLTEQNRYLLVERDCGEYTPRGKKILEHTPLGRLGAPEDLLGTVLWLVSPASVFVTGVVVPVDGGFSAYGGV